MNMASRMAYTIHIRIDIASHIAYTIHIRIDATRLIANGIRRIANVTHAVLHIHFMFTLI